MRSFVFGVGLATILSVAAVGYGGDASFLRETLRRDDAVSVTLRDAGTLGGGTTSSVSLTLCSTGGIGGRASLTLMLSRDGMSTETVRRTARLRARPGIQVDLPYRWNHAGPTSVSLAVTLPGAKQPAYASAGEATIPHYYASDFGEKLGRLADGGELWWCGSTHKVTPGRAAPTASSDGIRLAAAGRERQHAQLVLRPRTELGGIRIECSSLRGPDGAMVPSSALRVREVAYVPVNTPTDGIGTRGLWPDALPWIGEVWKPVRGRNNPLWITINVPPGLPAGDYVGHVRLSARNWRRDVPLRLHVWGFSLPEKTDLRSGFGISSDNVRRYHNLTSDEALPKVWDGYMRDFAEHRMCPYNPMQLAPIQSAEAKGEADAPSSPAPWPNSALPVAAEAKAGADTPSSPTAQMDFTAFDRAAERYLDGLGFNAFTIAVPGLGGGRHPNHDHGKIFDHAAGTSAYEALMADYGGKLQEHLETHGWLGKAYVYWYDEPEVADYPFVKEGMVKLKRWAPGLTRMLTEEFQPDLIGSVDLWCPITSNYNAAKARERQQQGEEVWWYICCGPKAPWCGEFIDHPAIEPRMWLWQTWKYGLQGILIWETTWWRNLPAERAGKGVQNPWEDAMSYNDSDADHWGNGDGRFFYPPNLRPNEDKGTEYFTEPIDSLRWELLSAGIQDWEYFHLLEKLVKKAEARGDKSIWARNARRLLDVPPEICTDMTHYTRNPDLLDAHRSQLARAIEEAMRSGGGR